jgi:multisubunit Na+/H+ antiporter MnhB subunit
MTLDCRKNTPVDHARTTRQHAGEALKNGANAPGLAGAAVAVIALTVGLFAVAAGHPGGGAIALIVAVVLGALSAVWLLRAHRKARDAELRWHAAHSERPAPPPSS